MRGAKSLVVPARIQGAIVILRGHRVMLDAGLAVLYAVSTKRLNEQVRRDRERFPGDFMFQLTASEVASLRSQIATLDAAGRGRIAMLSSVLGSAHAIQVNIEIMRAFVHLRQLLQTNAELASRLTALESRYDGQFRVVFDAIRKIMAPTPRQQRRIGFRTAKA